MKVIIPLAGKGTRLRPHTHITPKPMLRIAGKPVIDYVMDDLKKVGGVEEVIYITGHLKEKVRKLIAADGKRDRRLWEIATLAVLRDRLRAGDVWVEGSRVFRPLEAQLMLSPAFEAP